MPERLRRTEPPPCPVCKRTMRLVGRKSRALASKAEVLTFECDCGQTVSTTTDH